MTKRILVTGSIAYDILLGYEGDFTDAIQPASLDSLSVSFFSPHYQRHYGGTAANIAWDLKLLGADPLLIGTVGSDGGEYVLRLKKNGIDTRSIEVLPDHITSTAIINTDSQAHQIAFFHPGADLHGSWPSFDSAQDDTCFAQDDISYAIVGARDTSLMMKGMEWCHVNDIPVLFDPGQQVIAFSDDELNRMVRMSSGVVVNEYEWSILKEKLRVTEENFLMLSPLLIVTRGEHGLTFFDEHGAQSVSACPATRLLNPTGAGDAFRAGLLVGLTRGWTLLSSCRLGAAMGSKIVEHEEVQVGTIDIAQLWQRSAKTYGEVLPELFSVPCHT